MRTNLVFTLFLGTVLAALFAGCATTHVDWNARIGNYTFDQAVSELGPPDKQAKFTDGQTVAEWITRYYGGGSSVIIGSGYYGRPGGGVGYVQNVGPNTYESSLLLTFTTNNVLAKWSKR